MRNSQIFAARPVIAICASLFAALPSVGAPRDSKAKPLVAAQDPFRMGYLGVKTALAALRGEKVEWGADPEITPGEAHALVV